MIKLARTPLSIISVAVLSIGVIVSTQISSFAAEPTTHIVEITGFKFVPESVLVKAGDTVTWINKDIAPHTATANNMSFDTGELKQNESGSITFTNDQTVRYFCKFHPGMQAILKFE